MDSRDHTTSTTSWRARVRFVQDLAPRGAGGFMTPERCVVLRLSDRLYRRTPWMLAAVAIGWLTTALAVWPVVSFMGLVLWSLLVALAWGAMLVHWRRSDRPMLRPGGEPAWAVEHISYLWLLHLCFAAGAVLVYPPLSAAHQSALCILIASIGGISAIFSISSLRALAAVLGPTIGLVAAALILRGDLGLAAAVSLSGGLAVLAAVGLHQVSVDSARRDVETS